MSEDHIDAVYRLHIKIKEQAALIQLLREACQKIIEGSGEAYGTGKELAVAITVASEAKHLTGPEALKIVTEREGK